MDIVEFTLLTRLEDGSAPYEAVHFICAGTPLAAAPGRLRGPRWEAHAPAPVITEGVLTGTQGALARTGAKESKRRASTAFAVGCTEPSVPAPLFSVEPTSMAFPCSEQLCALIRRAVGGRPAAAEISRVPGADVRGASSIPV